MQTFLVPMFIDVNNYVPCKQAYTCTHLIADCDIHTRKHRKEQIYIQAERQTDAHTNERTNLQTDRHAYKRTGMHTNGQAYIQTDRHTYKRTGIYTNEQAYIQGNRHTYKQRDRQSTTPFCYCLCSLQKG